MSSSAAPKHVWQLEQPYGGCPKIRKPTSIGYTDPYHMKQKVVVVKTSRKCGDRLAKGSRVDAACYVLRYLSGYAGVPSSGFDVVLGC